MHAILFCDKPVTCIPVQDMPETCLPYGNIPLLVHILRFLERSGFSGVTLVHADEETRALAESLPLQVELIFADTADAHRTTSPTLVLRRLCLPQWDMGELHALCEHAPVRLLHPDGTPTHAELHPAASVLAEPQDTVTAVLSHFNFPETPQDYRRMQQAMLRDRRMVNFRIGQGVRIGKQTQIGDTCIIGNDCVIGERAVLEDCVLGDGVQVGADAVLRRCVLCRHSLVDRGVTLGNAALGQGEIAAAHRDFPVKRRFCVDAQDGIHEGLPRWNSAQTALQAGAAMTALGMRLAVGFDCPEAAHLALAAAAGAVSQGAQVWQGGVCALSQLIHAAKTVGCDAALWVIGDAVQVLRPCGADGFPLSASQNRRLQQALAAKFSTKIVAGGKLLDARSLTALWENKCRSILPKPAFTIEVCCGNKALRETALRLFSGGTGERIVLNLSEDGTQASAFSTEAGLVHREQLLLLSLLSFRERGEALALPADFHPAAEGFAARFGGRILRMFTPNVSPTAAKLFAEQGVCTDGILLFAHILRVLDRRGLTLAGAVSLLPPMHTVRRLLSTSLGRQAVEKLRRQNPDRMVHIELSSQGKLLQLMAHAESMEAAAELCGFWEKKVRAAEDGSTNLSQIAE